MFRRAKSLVGLDIGSSAVKAVELKPAGKSYKVTAFGTEPIPPDSIVDGAIIDGAAVADAIRRLFDGRGIKTKDVAASLSGNAVIVKKITLPMMSEAELAESIYWEAEQYIPFDIQDVNLDYQILDKGDAPAARGRWTCCWSRRRRRRSPTTPASSPRRAAPPWSSTSTPSRCRTPTRSTTASSPTPSSCCSTPARARPTSTSCSGDQSVFTRDISIGGNAYTEALQNELNLPFEIADALKRGHAGRRRDATTTRARCCAR